MTKVVVGFSALLIILATIGAVHADTFVFTSYGSSSLTSFDGYNSISYREQGVGNYGAYITPEGVRGGWSTTGSSGSFGYAYDTDYGTEGNQGAFTSIGVNSRGLRGSYVNGGQYGSYGAFAVGNGRVNYAPYYRGGWGSSQWNVGYPSGIPYASSRNSYAYNQNVWY